MESAHRRRRLRGGGESGVWTAKTQFDNLSKRQFAIASAIGLKV